MDPTALHMECKQLVYRTRSIISEVEKKMSHVLEENNQSAKIENHPIWVRCLLWFCHS